MPQIKTILISRTDSIGDVVLTLPVAKVLKAQFPHAAILFLGKSYTQPVIEACPFIDRFIDVDDFMRWRPGSEDIDCVIHVFPVAAIARKAKQLCIPLRIGTTNRLYHWTTCNRLVRLSRKNSDLHEAALNMQLLEGLSINVDTSASQGKYYSDLIQVNPLSPEYEKYLDRAKVNLILHPKSQGSAREWGIDNFSKLIHLLDRKRFNLLISGTAQERPYLEPIFDKAGDKVKDITGVMNLTEFMSFIYQCEGMVANSTGPLHIAGVLDKHAFGIYPPMRPIHPGRWAPLGEHVHIFVQQRLCNDCRKKPTACHCMQDIKPEDVAKRISAVFGTEK